MDAARFQAQVKQVEKLLFRIAWSYLGNLQDVEDAVQDAICTAWAKQGTLRDERQFGPWLARILTNRCKNLIRRSKLLAFLPLEETTLAAAPEPFDEVKEALLSLPPELRLVLAMRYYEGCSVKEIAQGLGIPQGTVQTRLMRGRRKLREVLSIEWEVDA